MTNYQYRKYDGAPHSEKKKDAPQEPSKLAPRGKKKRKKDVVFTNLYQISTRKGWEDKLFCVHIGKDIGVWGSYRAGEHVLRRMKANILKDTRTSLFWIESQIKGPISPEFHDFVNLMNWLVFTGLHEGWLFVSSETITKWRSNETFRLTRLRCR